MSELTLEFRGLASDDGRDTTCALSVSLGGTVIWPSRSVTDAEIDIQIDDLLAHLTEFWKPLNLRQTYPLSFNPVRPSQLRVLAERRWAEQPEPVAEAEDEIVEAFQDCHDLSRAFAGYFDLPALWIIRSGEDVLIETPGCFEQVGFSAARAALEEAGNLIAQRLSSLPGGRWDSLIAAWQRRDIGDGLRLLGWSTSLDPATAASLVSNGLLRVPLTVGDAANDDDEIRIAARMASALPQSQIRDILTRIVAFPKQHAPELDELSEDVRTHLNSELAGAKPFEEGVGAARFVRGRLAVDANATIDVLALMEGLGVAVHQEMFGPPTLDALAVWGARHGPAALVNKRSERHVGTGDFMERGQVRATLAHELCHLLIDRGHAFAAVDVLKSRMPEVIERRARAFAGELLLPTDTAAQAWCDAGRPLALDELKTLIEQLCRDFKVSKSVASWKLEHGAKPLGVHLGDLLDMIVPQR